MKNKLFVGLCIVILFILVGAQVLASPSFVGSKNSDVYHYPSCYYVNNIKLENRVYFETPEDAINAGYRPCKVCKPPTSASTPTPIPTPTSTPTPTLASTVISPPSISLTATPAILGKNLTIHFIDVDQGDSILIQTPNGKNLLIDGGEQEAGSKVVSYLQAQGVNQIDVLIATHPHSDHIGGLFYLSWINFLF